MAGSLMAFLIYPRLPFSSSTLSSKEWCGRWDLQWRCPDRVCLREWLISIGVRPIARLRSSRPTFWFQMFFRHLHEMLLLRNPGFTLQARSQRSHLRRHCISLYNHYIYTLNYTFGEKALREQRSQIPWESLAFQTETILDKMTVSLCDYVHVIACNIYIVKLHKASYPSSHRHWSFLLLMNFQHLDGQLESSIMPCSIMFHLHSSKQA